MTVTTHQQKVSIAKRRHVLLSVLQVTVLSLLVTFIINFSNWYINGFDMALNTINANYRVALSELTQRSIQQGARVEAVSHWMVNDEPSGQISSRWMNGIDQTLVALHIKSDQLSLMSEEVVMMLLSTIKTQWVKWLGVFSSWFLFLLASCLGVLDGLVNRYKRVMQGGGDVVHSRYLLIKKFSTLPILLLGIYFMVPMTVSPLWMVTVLTVFSYWYAMCIASSMKKVI